MHPQTSERKASCRFTIARATLPGGLAWPGSHRPKTRSPKPEAWLQATGCGIFNLQPSTFNLQSSIFDLGQQHRRRDRGGPQLVLIALGGLNDRTARRDVGLLKKRMEKTFAPTPWPVHSYDRQQVAYAVKRGFGQAHAGIGVGLPPRWRPLLLGTVVSDLLNPKAELR